MKIAINGAGVAGPTLAWWLRKSGHQVLLVERSPHLRAGGYAIDFWGIGYDIADKMGLIPRIREVGYHVSEMRYVDEAGRVTGEFPVAVLDRMTHGRYTQLRRTDLATAICGALDDEVEMLFGDSVARIDQRDGHARIEFEHAAPREVDLVIGADGLHSRVRELAFGPTEKFETPLDYHLAAFEVDGYRPYEARVATSHGIAGRQITKLCMPGDKTLFLFVFRDEYLRGRGAPDESELRPLLKEVFAPGGWETPRILAAMERAGEIYFDRVSQIRMDRWSDGRVALLGDAAACVSLLAGEGTGLAMAEAYVLAGELHASGGDWRKAFATWQARLQPFILGKQIAAAKFASTFAPKTDLGVAFRDRVSNLLRIPALANLLLGRAVRDDIELPDYPFD